MTNPKTMPGALAPYVRAGYHLIRLHKWDAVSQWNGKIREDGKRPVDAAWTKSKTTHAEARVWMEDSGKNVGVLLSAGQLVVDVDPRNFGDDDSWARLCRDLDLDPLSFPAVETGSGGFHFYCTKPDDTLVVDSLEAYPGVEFKSRGRQVVSAGSIHPCGRNYSWDPLAPPLEEAPACPERLLNKIRRAPRTLTVGGGEYSQEEVALALDALDPEDFREHSAWLTLMMACHHASNGDARYEFMEWSSRDPMYRDAGHEVGVRWDSLSRTGSDGGAVTHRTLDKLLRDAGREDVIPRPTAQEDFRDEDPDADAREQRGIPVHERKGPLERMNEDNILILDRGSPMIYYQAEDPEFDPPRSYWESTTAYGFRLKYGNRRLQRGEKTVELGDAWLSWSGRRDASGVLFDPERDHGDRWLNLWTGMAVPPQKGDWSIFNALVRDVLCAGDEAVYKYVLDWTAHMIQHPGSPAEVALCFQGDKGTGKSTFGRILCALYGPHGLPVTSSEQVTGRFNAHLRNVILLFADEAIKPYDKEAENRLKAFITEPRLAFEKKGKDITSGRNYLHVVMASNDDWFVPMGLQGERRFLLQRVSNVWQGRHDKFAALYAQMLGGEDRDGLRAFLWDMLDRDISDFEPRRGIPTTVAAIDQRIRNMDPVAQWWYNCLWEGVLPMDLLPGYDNWDAGEARIIGADASEAFTAWAREAGIRHPGGHGRGLRQVFAAEMRKVCPNLHVKRKALPPKDRYDVRVDGNGRVWAWGIPSLAESREDFEKTSGVTISWPEDDPLEL